MKWMLIGILGLMVGASTVEASSPSQQTTRRLDTGTIISQNTNWKWGADNKLIVTNGQSLDAVVTLSQDNKPMIAVYVRAGDVYVWDSIWHSTYSLSWVLGEDWDSDAAAFTRKTATDRFDQPLAFDRTVIPDIGVQYSFWKAYLGSPRPNDSKTLEQLGGVRPFPKIFVFCPNPPITDEDFACQDSGD